MSSCMQDRCSLNYVMACFRRRVWSFDSLCLATTARLTLRFWATMIQQRIASTSRNTEQVATNRRDGYVMHHVNGRYFTSIGADLTQFIVQQNV